LSGTATNTLSPPALEKSLRVRCSAPPPAAGGPPYRQRDVAAGRLPHDPAASPLGRHQNENRQSHLSRHGDYGLHEERGKLETAQQIANHESPRTTKLYDRPQDEISLDEVERIVI